MLDENKNNPLNTDAAGAVWERKSKQGTVYYTGTILGHNVVMFKFRGRNEKSPAFIFKKREQFNELDVKHGDLKMFE